MTYEKLFKEQYNAVKKFADEIHAHDFSVDFNGRVVMGGLVGVKLSISFHLANGQIISQSGLSVGECLSEIKKTYRPNTSDILK